MRIFNNRCLKEIKELRDYVSDLVVEGGNSLTPEQVEALNQVATNKNNITNLSTDISNLTKVIPTKISQLDDDIDLLLSGDIVDNLLSDATNLPLSARAGNELNNNKLDSMGLKSKEIPFGNKTNFYMRLASKQPWHKAFALVMGYDNIHGVIFEVVNAWVLADGTTIKFLTKSLSSKNYTWVEDNTSNWNVHATGFQTNAKVFVLYSGFDAIDVY